MADYIDREALLTHQYNASHSNLPQLAEMVVGVEDIEDAPAADVAPVVHGRWIEKTAPGRKKYFECSRCGAHENKHTAIKGYYCWRCGAKMDGGDGDAAD